MPTEPITCAIGFSTASPSKFALAGKRLITEGGQRGFRHLVTEVLRAGRHRGYQSFWEQVRENVVFSK